MATDVERLHSCWVLEDVLILVHKGTCALAGACVQITLGPALPHGHACPGESSVSFSCRGIWNWRNSALLGSLDLVIRVIGSSRLFDGRGLVSGAIWNSGPLSDTGLTLGATWGVG